jgi:hypothetical protein
MPLSPQKTARRVCAQVGANHSGLCQPEGYSNNHLNLGQHREFAVRAADLQTTSSWALLAKMVVFDEV